MTITDAQTGAEAEIAPGLGFNCFRFTAQPADGPLEVLWAHPDFVAGNERPSGSGIPLLFPFPGRIRRGEFRFDGKSYCLEPGDPLGNAIHGFALNRPWRVIDQQPHRIVGRFHASQVDPSLADAWPADFCLTVTYQLQGNSLESEITIENPDQRPLPWGFGTHPYFRVPLDGDSARCQVQVPAASYWKLDDMLPTGETLPVDDARDLRRGKPFDETQLDDVLSDLAFDRGWCTARIDDAARGRAIVMTFDDAFPHAVVYNPPHRQAICIEPYTCVPDPFWLEEQGKPAGLRVLEPGGSLTARITIAVQ